MPMLGFRWLLLGRNGHDHIGLLIVAAFMVGVFVVTGLINPEQVDAGKSMAGEALGPPVKPLQACDSRRSLRPLSVIPGTIPSFTKS